MPVTTAAAHCNNHDEFYRELVSRNRHFVAPATQEGLRKLRILVAGCGSTGGACIEALVRAGAEHLMLADNGEYELSNLNRQHVRLDHLGENKAEYHAGEVRAINPYTDVKTFPEGVSEANVDEICSWADFIMDGVDVTTPEGIRYKILLHERAKHFRRPVLAGLDLGYLQWGRSYDYRNSSLRVLDGRLERSRKAGHPIQALFEMYGLGIIPSHCLPLVIDLLEGRASYASQMGCTSDLLSGVIVPAAFRFVETGELIRGWNLDMGPLRYSRGERLRIQVRSFGLRRKLARLMKG